jgi:hypothetical protein
VVLRGFAAPRVRTREVYKKIRRSEGSVVALVARGDVDRVEMLRISTHGWKIKAVARQDRGQQSGRAAT